MARPKQSTGETLQLQMEIPDDELAAIIVWRHANQVTSTAEAIRRLCKIGLEAEVRSRRSAALDELGKLDGELLG